MSRLRTIPILSTLMFAAVLAAGSTLLRAEERGRNFISERPAPAVSHRYNYGGYVQPYFFGSYGFYGGYYSPFVSVPSLPPAYPYLPNYWWVSPYPLADPRQSGYNPASGYARDSVTTLILETQPAKSRVILDGIYVGTSNYLGPIQLPVGEHILRVESAGFEPSETVLNIEQPVLQQLTVKLKRTAAASAEPKQ